MAWDVGEIEVFGTDELDGGAFEHGVVFFADESRVLDGFLEDIVYVLEGLICECQDEGEKGGGEAHGSSANYTNIVFV